MFVVDRSALAVILPLVLLVAVVLWSNRPAEPVVTGVAGQGAREERAPDRTQTVAANLPSR